MSHDPHDTPRIDLSSLLRRQVEVVVANAPSAAPAADPAPAPSVAETGGQAHHADLPESATGDLPAPATGALPEPAAAPVDTPADLPPVPSPTPAVDDWQAAFERRATATAHAATGPADTAAAPVPGFLRRQIQRPASPWLWIPVVLLGLLLALQILLADRSRLAANPTLRPLLNQLCVPLGCALPPWHEPQAITLVQRSVTPLQDRPGVLEIQAELRNDAAWTQALPVIELTLSSADGQVSGQRQFLPAHYLADGGPSLLRPGQQVQARWWVAEPDVPADAFHFRFR